MYDPPPCITCLQEVEINYELAQGDYITLQLYDIVTGNLVHTMEMNNFKGAGSNTKMLDKSNIPSGLYKVIIHNNNEILDESMINF